MKSDSHFFLKKIDSPSCWETISLLGIRFFAAGSFKKAVEILVEGPRGLVVFPSGPGLAQDLWEREHYRQAIQTADLVFADSGAMVLFWRILSGQKVPRYSGLKIFSEVVQQPIFREVGATFWVMPSQDQLRINLQWLQQTMALPISEADCYCAPSYKPTGPVEDRELLEILKKRRPCFIILCIGGGIQERLGYFLRNELGKSASTILCTGAAVGFLSGIQAHIPLWADFLFLGWLFRCMKNPKKFIPRYLRSFSLMKAVFLYWLYGRVPQRLFFSHRPIEVFDN